ncbi:hypothetical protein [Actinokineospora sp. NPDC004072]
MAATTPRSGNPTTAAQAPSATAPPNNATNNARDPRTPTVAPRRNPPQGNKGANSSGTGNTSGA